MNEKEIENKKKIIIAIVAALIVLVIGVVAFILLNGNAKDEKAKGAKQPKKEAITNQEIIKDENYSNLSFTNTTFIKEGNYYTLSMDVTNPTQNDINVEQVNIVMKDKDGNNIVEFLGYIGDPMKPGEVRTITASTQADLTKVVSKTIEPVKEG